MVQYLELLEFGSEEAEPRRLYLHTSNGRAEARMLIKLTQFLVIVNCLGTGIAKLSSSPQLTSRRTKREISTRLG